MPGVTPFETTTTGEAGYYARIAQVERIAEVPYCVGVLYLVDRYQRDIRTTIVT